MKVFLTGGSGLLGRHVRRACNNQNIDVYAPTHQQVDLKNPSDVLKAMEGYSPDVVVHCAGLVGGIADNIRRPYDYCFTNLQLGLSVVEAARHMGVQRLVNISSANIYPDTDSGGPLSESLILSGRLNDDTLGYGLAKGCTAKLVELCNEQYGVHYRNLIPTNLYGEWDDFTPEHSHMIPGIMRRLHMAAQSRESTVEIWGDGSARRAFLYAGDLARFLVDNLSDLSKLPQHLNVAPAKDYSVLEYNQIIAEVVGYKGAFHFNLDKPVGVAMKQLDTTAAKRVGWNPTTDIHSGVERLYQYFLSENL